MPEATARFDDDFEDAPRSRAKSTRGKTRASDRKKPGVLAALRQRPGRTLFVGLFVGALFGIVANATLMQSARHPAPIFGGASPVAAPAQPQATTAAPAPAAPAQRPADSPAPHAASAPSSLTGLIKATLGGDAPVAHAPAKDPIAALLKGDAPADKSNRVASVQRALQKVGFVVKPDGNFGLGTKQALERFERDRGLQVTGEMTPRTLRELAAQSGVAIP